MRKLIVFGLILLLLLGGLIGFAASNLNSLVNASKDRLLAQAERALGRTLQIGEIEISLWGGVGARLQNVALADDPAFSSETFVQATEVQVKVKLMPLLRQEIEVRRVSVRDPVIRVIRNAEGVFNFASLVKGETRDAPPQTSEATPASSATSGADGLPLLLVALANISNGDIHYTDQGTNTELRVSQIDLEVEDLSFDQPLSLELAAALLSKRPNLHLAGSFGPLGREAELLAVDASLRLDPLDSAVLPQALPQLADALPPGLGLSGPLRVSSRISGTVRALMVSDLRLTAAVFESDQANLQVTGEAGPLAPDMAALSLKTDIALGPVGLPQLLQFAPLAEYLPAQLSAEGRAAVTVHAEGRLNNLALTATVDATDSALQFGGQFQKPQGTRLVASTNARLTPERVAVQGAKIQMHTLALTSHGELTLGKPLGLDLHLDSNTVDLAGWQEILPEMRAFSPGGQMELDFHIKATEEGRPTITGTLDLREASASLAQLPQPVTALNTSLTFTGQGADIQNASAQLGGSALEFTASVARFSPLKASYRLRSPELWLADVQAGDGWPSASDVLRDFTSEGRLRLENKRLAFNATLSSTHGRLVNVDYSDIHTALAALDRTVRLERLSLHTLGGSVSASGRYEMGAAPPRFQFASQLTRIELAGLFKAYLPGALDAARGTASLTLGLTGHGRDWPAIQASLDGQGELEVTDGALVNMNIADEVLRRLSGIPGLTALISPEVRARYPALFSRHGTEFSRLGSQFRLSQGKILLDAARLDAAGYAARGKGWLDYEQNIDFQGQLILAKDLSQDIQASVRLASLLSNAQGQITLPFALSGNLPGVKPVPDVAAVAQRVQHGVVTSGLEALQEKVLDKLLPPPPDEDTHPEQEDSPTGPVTPQDMLREGLEGLFGR